jgi:hypothetical protein
VHEAAPSGLVLPAGHAKHVCAPAKLNVLGRHAVGKHVSAPACRGVGDHIHVPMQSPPAMLDVPAGQTGDAAHLCKSR